MTGGKETKNLRCYDSGDDAHNPVTADGNSVARAAVGGGQDLGCIGVEGAVVDILPIARQHHRFSHHPHIDLVEGRQ